MSLVGTGRDRNKWPATQDQRYDTLIHAQPNTTGSGISGITAAADWQIAVPVGVYNVTMAVGEPNGRSTNAADVETHQVVVEGTPLLATPFVQPAFAAPLVNLADHHRTATLREVAVTDGLLTLSFPQPPIARNTKVNFIDIVQVVPAPTGVAATAGAGVNTVTWNAVTEAVTYRVYRNGTAIGDVAAPSLTLEDSSFPATGQFDYEVTAIDALGNESGRSLFHG